MNPIFDMRPTGRLCVRMCADGYIATGVLHFPETFRPEEGTAYPLLFNGNSVEAAPIALGRIPEHLRDDGFSGWAGSAVWPQLSVSGFAARYVQAFENGWSMLAVTRADPFDGVLPAEQRRLESAHYWVDVEDGVVRGIEPPVKPKAVLGTAIGQLCTNLCVWPDAQGRPHTLPVLLRETRRAFDMAGTVTGLYATGKLGIDAMNQMFRTPALHGLGVSTSDEMYVKYLAVIEKYDMRCVGGGPTSAAVHQRVDAFSGLAVEAMVNGVLDDPAVVKSLRTAASKSAYERAPSYLMAESWEHILARGSQATTRWVLDPATYEVVAAQVYSDGDWHKLGKEAVLDLNESLRDNDVVDSSGDFELETVKVLPLWAILAQAKNAENVQVQSAQPDSRVDDPSNDGRVIAPISERDYFPPTSP